MGILNQNNSIDPKTGLTQENSSKPQTKKESPFTKYIANRTSRITPHRTDVGMNIGTDLFGKSNLERVQEEYGDVNVLAQDFEYLKAKEQPWTHQAAGFLNQAAVGEIVGGTIESSGYLTELPSIIKGLLTSEEEFQKRLVSAQNNPLVQTGEEMKEWARAVTPILQTGEGFNMGDPGWWFSNGVSIASSLSLMIPAMGATKGIGLIGKGIARLGKRGAAVSKAFGGTSKAGQLARRGVTQATISRHMENMLESSGTFKDVYQQRLTQVNPKTGKLFTKEEATKSASSAASHNYKVGWTMLAQDIIQYSLLGKYTNPVTGRSVNKIEEAVYGSLKKGGKVGQFLNKNRGIGGAVTAFVSEAAEESFQYIAAEDSKYLSDVDAGIAKESDFSKRLGDYSTDGDMWTAAFFGGFGGLAVDIVGGRAQRKEAQEFLAKQQQFLNVHGSIMSKMADDIDKADKSGDIGAQITTRIKSNVAMTVTALSNDSYDFHIAQLKEWQEAAKDLETYNKENPDITLTPEFVSEVLPEMIKDTESIKAEYDKAVKNNYESDTIESIVLRNHAAKKYKERGTQAKKDLQSQLDNSILDFSSTGSVELQQTLEEIRLLQKKEVLTTLINKSGDSNSIKWAKKELPKIEGELNRVKEQKEKFKKEDTRSELDKQNDTENINAVIAEGGSIDKLNAVIAASELFSRKEALEAANLESPKHQSSIFVRKTDEAIRNSPDIERLNEIEENIVTQNLSKEQKQSLVDQIEARKIALKNTATKEEAAREAAAREEEVAREAEAAQEAVNETTPTETPTPQATPTEDFSEEGATTEWTPKAARVSPEPTSENLPVEDITPVPEPTQSTAKPTQQNNNIEAKKADIERRRQEELDEIIEIHHATDTEFEKFKSSKIGSKSGNTGFLGEGFYFSLNKNDFIKTWGNIIKTVSISKNLKLYKDTVEDRKNIGVDKSILELTNYGGKTKEITELLKSKGYHGVYVEHSKEENEVVIFDEKNIIYTNKKEINAKYDAELAALEPTQQTKKVELKPSTETKLQQETKNPSSVGKANIVSTSSFPGWRTWLESGAVPEGTKVRINLLSEKELNESPKRDGNRLFKTIEKLRKGQTVSKEDKVYLIDKYPIAAKVLDDSGNPLFLGNDPVFAYIYDTYSGKNINYDHRQKSRMNRGNIIAGLIQNGEVETTLSSNSNQLYNSKISGDTLENNVALLDSWRLTNTPSDFLLINSANQYVTGKDRKLDTDVKQSGVFKDDGNSSGGNIYIKLNSPNKTIIPVKLNKKKVEEEEADIIANLFFELLSNPTDSSWIKSPAPKEIIAKIEELVPEFKSIIKKTPTISDAINFFIYYNSGDIKKRKSGVRKPGDILLSNQRLIFNYVPVMESVTNEDGVTSERHKMDKKGNYLYTSESVNLDTIQGEDRAKFINYLMTVKRRNIDYNNLIGNKNYRDYILGDKVLNTDIMEGVYVPNGGQHIKLVIPEPPTITNPIKESTTKASSKKITAIVEEDNVDLEGGKVEALEESDQTSELATYINKLKKEKKICPTSTKSVNNKK